MSQIIGILSQTIESHCTNLALRMDNHQDKCIINDTSGARSYAGAPFSTGRNSEDCAPITSGGTSVCNANRNSGHAALCYCDAGTFDVVYGLKYTA